MNKRPPILLLALAALLGLSQCKKDSPDPASLLPPATQTGANTFGCLINGQAFLPKGSDGSSNFDVVYDPTFRGGDVNIGAYRLADGREKYFSISVAPANSVGIYSFARPNGTARIKYSDKSKDAAQFPSPNECGLMLGERDILYRDGELCITRFDTQAGVISGTFSIKVLQVGCDTLRITQGRFDAKI